MAVGDRIKRARNLRGMTQKELGIAIGFEEKSADIRIAQYESNTRTPKEELLRKIAEVLDVNYRSLYEPTLYAAEDVMYTLFELDEHYPSTRLYEVTDTTDPDFPEKHMAVSFRYRLLDEFLKEWQLRKKQLREGEITKEEYLDFYRKVFQDYKEPLFWIHLNMDYPFNLKGILYFPKINTEYDSIEGTIKLYNNQVFIADNIKEVIPEFLMLLKGVIDCPDLPLNVSRSALQNDGFVKKISEYITKKVADKLIGMCKTEKENYEKYWDDISPFIKYGCLKDTKFCDKMNDYILFKDINDKYQTLPELLVPVEDEKKDDEKTTEDAKTEESKSDDAKEEEKEPERSTIYYVTDKAQQGQYIKMFKEQGMNAVILDHNIDTSFITQLEQRNEHYQFKRIDADVTDALKSDDAADLTEETNTLSDLFKKTLNNDKLTVKVESLKDADVASILTLSEQGRRMQDMMKMYAAGGMGGMDPNMFAADQTLTLNANNALVKYLFEHKDSEHSDMFAEQLYDLAMLSNQPLSAEAMTKFVKRSNDIMLLLTK